MSKLLQMLAEYPINLTNIAKAKSGRVLGKIFPKIVKLEFKMTEKSVPVTSYQANQVL